jgi:hypothetical protein
VAPNILNTQILFLPQQGLFVQGKYKEKYKGKIQEKVQGKYKEKYKGNKNKYKENSTSDLRPSLPPLPSCLLPFALFGLFTLLPSSQT